MTTSKLQQPFLEEKGKGIGTKGWPEDRLMNGEKSQSKVLSDQLRMTKNAGLFDVGFFQPDSHTISIHRGFDACR